MNLNKVPKQDYIPEQHGPVFRFFSTLGTHFTTIMSVNVLFLIFNIPMMLVAFAFSLFFLPTINSVFQPDNFVAFMNRVGLIGNEAVMNDIGLDAAYQLYYIIMVFCVMFLLGSTLICFGPFQAGFSQIYRNLYRESGVFLFTDFKEGMKKNFKQSLASMFISLVVTALILTGLGYYANLESRFGTAVTVFFVIMFFVFILVQNMVNQMIVSVDLPLSKMYKNAFLFFLLKFGPCLGLIGIMFLMLVVFPFALFVTTTYFAYAIAIFYYLTLALAVVQYMFAFYTGELINEYIGKAPSASVTTEEEEEEKEEETEEEDG
ncbi:MAG: DUF624 domain-containing protein [Clostridiales bacterium]|nr:DUF624 domain-containing protein [Clostridiales bacterium]HAW16211.1 hypothetical protein [Clostridiales bacterium]